jgi:ankyrin repeat protein
VKEFLAHKGDVNKAGAQGHTPLTLAAYSGSKDVVQVLIENHADVHVQSGMGNALMAASFHGYRDIVEILVRAGAGVNDVNAAGGPAQRRLDAAALAERQGNEELADLLRKAPRPGSVAK